MSTGFGPTRPGHGIDAWHDSCESLVCPVLIQNRKGETLNMDESPQTPSGETILCSPTTEPAVKWFIIAVMLIGFGIWCWFDRASYPPPDAWD